MYQKVVTYKESRALNDSHHESCPTDAVFSLQHIGSLPPATQLLPSELSSSADYLQSISSLFSVVNSKEPESQFSFPRWQGYIHSSIVIQLLMIIPLQYMMKMNWIIMVFCQWYIDGYLDSTERMNTCLSSFFQLIDKNKVLITGTMILFLEYALVFDESFGIVSYPCVTVDGCLKSIQVNEKWYTLVVESEMENTKMANVKEYIYQ